MKKIIICLFCYLYLFMIVGCQNAQVKNTNSESSSPLPMLADSPTQAANNTLMPQNNQSTISQPPKRSQKSNASPKITEPQASQEKQTEKHVENESMSPSKTELESIPSIQMSIKTYDGTNIISLSTFPFTEGESALDVLIRVCKERKIPVVISGGKKNGYVEGINNLFEFDEGAQSGWIYKINGERPSYSSGSYKLKVNDIIDWEYVLSADNIG